MKTIFLESLRLLNFKGVREFFATFTYRTDICGDNGTGKTTVLDVWLYLLFGKNSEDRSDFNIKTLDQNNKPIHHLDHEVEGILYDGERKITLKKVYKEKWTKKKGAEKEEMTGHTTDYFFNEIPLNQREYQDRISAIISEEKFKILTSTSYFNLMKWGDRRNILTDLIDEVRDADIINSSTRYAGLAKILADKTMDEYKRQIAGQIKKLKESIEEIPARINEANRTMPEKLDYEEIVEKADKVKGELASVEEQIEKESERANHADKKNQELQTEIYKLKGELSEIEHETRLKNIENKQKATGRQAELKGLIEIKQRTIDNVHGLINDYKRKLTELNDLRTDLVKQWEEQSSRTMDESGEFVCPVSKRACPDDELVNSKRDEIVKEFNLSVSKAKESINARGLQVKGEIEAVTNKITELEKEIELGKKDLQDAQKELEQSAPGEEAKEIDHTQLPEFKELQTKMAEIEAQKTEVVPANTGSLKEQKAALLTEIDQLRDQYRTKELREKLEQRITELSNSESKISQEIAELEKIEFTIKSFEKAKIDTITEKVNAKFEYVQFKMFKELLNGGFEPTCETMVDGVPYSDLNTAGRINAGIAIINTLSEEYQTKAPVFADEANLVNKFMETKSQFIRLLVTNDKELKVINH